MWEHSSASDHYILWVKDHRLTCTKQTGPAFLQTEASPTIPLELGRNGHKTSRVETYDLLVHLVNGRLPLCRPDTHPQKPPRTVAGS